MFSLTDFKNKDVSTKLMCLVMTKLYNNPFKGFNELSYLEKREFNIELNKYINQNLAVKLDWEEILLNDFNKTVCDYMDSDKFKPEKFNIPIGDKVIILNDEQKSFLQTEVDAGDEVAKDMLELVEKGDNWMLEFKNK